MKKLILAMALLSISFGVNAQKKTTTTKAVQKETTYDSYSSSSEGFRKGNFAITGAFGISSGKGAFNQADVNGNQIAGEGTVFKFLPSGQYFLTNNLSLYATLGVQNVSPKNGDSSSTFIFGAGVRYYFTPSSKFSLFGQGGILFKSPKDSTEFEVGVKPGISYFVSNHFFLESTVGFIGVNNVSPKQGDSSTNFNLGVDLSQVGIGVGYKF